MTGGSSGIGHAMAVALARAGARVAIVSRRRPENWSQPPSAGCNGEIEVVRADLSSESATLSALQHWLGQHGEAVDALITSAVDYASPSRHAFVDTTVAEWNKVFDVNVKSAFLTVRAVLPRLLAKGAGLIVGITSDVAFAPGPFRVAYAASKAAARALFDGVAAETGGRGVNVVQLLPNRQVATPGLAGRRAEGFDFSAYLDPSVFAAPICRLVYDLGMGRNGDVITVGS